MTQKAMFYAEGMQKLRKDLRAAAADLPGGTGKQNQWVTDLKEAYRSVGKVIVPRAVSEAPRRSGRLAGTIRSSGTTTKAEIKAGRASVPYANPIHWGWKSRWPNYVPQPFLSRAAERTKSKWVDEFQKGVSKLLARVGDKA